MAGSEHDLEFLHHSLSRQRWKELADHHDTQHKGARVMSSKSCFITLQYSIMCILVLLCTGTKMLTDGVMGPTRGSMLVLSGPLRRQALGCSIT